MSQDDQCVVDKRRADFRRRRVVARRQDSLPLIEEASQAPAKNCRRLVVLGSTRVGKSAIVNRFLNNTFDPVHRPNVDSCYRKVYRIKGETYCLEILDTSSVTQNPALRRVPLVTGKKRVFLGVSVIGYLHTYSADVRTCTSRYMYIHAHTIIVYKKNIYSMHGLRKDASYIRSV